MELTPCQIQHLARLIRLAKGTSLEGPIKVITIVPNGVRNGGNKGNRRALRASYGHRRGRRRHLVFQAPFMGATVC